MGTLSVRENLHFSAALRLPSRMTRAERKERVEKVIDELGLRGCASTKVQTDCHVPFYPVITASSKGQLPCVLYSHTRSAVVGIMICRWFCHCNWELVGVNGCRVLLQLLVGYCFNCW